MPRRSFEIFGGPEYPIPRFSAGAVAKIVGLDDVWKLQKLLDSPRYRLKASGQLGEGKGSRRWFTDRDAYRIGIAAHLIRDGFAPKVVSAVLEDIEDRELIEVDEAGRKIGFVTLSRGTKGPKVGSYRSSKPPEIKPEGPIYYAFDLGAIIESIDDRITKFMTEKGRS